MKKRTLAIAAFAVVAFASCVKNNGGTSTPRAGILVDLVSPNATNTTIILNGNTIGTNVSYGSVPNFYNQVTPGNGNLSAYSSTTAQILNTSFTAEAGNFYSMFIVDSVSKLKTIIVADSVNYPGTTDSVKVRFYNFAPNSIPINVSAKDTGGNSTIVLQNRPFESQGSANATNIFMPMKAGTYQFQLFNPFSATTSLRDTSITLEGKHIYTIFVKGFYPDTTSTSTTRLGFGVVKHG